MFKLVPIDFIFLAIILITSIVALIRGFIKEIFGKIAFIAGIFCAIFFYARLSLLFEKFIQNRLACEIISFILIFIVVFIIICLIGNLISAACHFDIIASLDRVLGFMLGIVEGLAIVALVIFVLNIQPFFDAMKFLDGSFFYNMIDKFLKSPEVMDLVVTNV